MKTNLTPEDLRIAHEKVNAGQAVLLDVRTEWERREDGLAPESMHMDYEEFVEGKLPDIAKDTTIYVHCRSGGRSGIVVQVLKSHGFTDVVNVGGLKDWQKV